MLGHGLNCIRLHGTLLHHLFAVARADGVLGPNLLIHQGLGLRRLLGFVVPASPITYEIDYYILTELHPIVRGKLGRKNYRLRIIPIDMEDGRLNHLRNFRAVLG